MMHAEKRRTPRLREPFAVFNCEDSIPGLRDAATRYGGVGCGCSIGARFARCQVTEIIRWMPAYCRFGDVIVSWTRDAVVSVGEDMRAMKVSLCTDTRIRGVGGVGG